MEKNINAHFNQENSSQWKTQVAKSDIQLQ